MDTFIPSNIVALWIIFASTSVIILFSGKFLASSTDTIAVRTGLGHTFVGFVLLATATSIPELATGISSIQLLDQPDIAAGDVFGSNLFNLLIIGVLDVFWRNEPILRSVADSNTIAIATFGIVVFILAIQAIFLHEMWTGLNNFLVSPIAIAIFIVFLISLFLVHKISSSSTTDDDATSTSPNSPIYKTYLTYLISASIIVITAIFLSFAAEKIAHVLDWETSFVGTQFVAFSTSLPELASSIAAVRLGVPKLAIAGLLGSNLFNMGFVMFIDELAYTNGSFWGAIDETHIFTASTAILMTAIVIAAMAIKSRRRIMYYFSIESILLISAYTVTSVLIFLYSKN